MSKPLVSIILALYNSERWLKEAVDSIIGQTLREFELIVIDDGSTDKGVSIVQSYGDPRIRLIVQENAGLAAALNRGIEAANAAYICRFDPDDICQENRLEVQYNFLVANPKVVAVGSAAMMIDEEGLNVCVYSKPQDHLSLLNMIPGSPFIHPSVMFKKEAYKRAGGYPELMRLGGEDAVLFGRMAQVGELCNIPDPLIYYRISASALSRKSKQFRSFLTELIKAQIAGKEVTSDDLSVLHRLSTGSSQDKRFYYHADLSRMYAWGGGQSLSRKHALGAIALKPWSLMSYLIIILSFLPSGFVQKLYYLVKKERFHK
ncbi:MAG: hypothetical protein AUK35_09085 [Zetaproteobacteria bacterium CG2_30_46_52]|nr:MAG: hypothetical protein AUK35_09085 [Zetaproteobacteria bacterium CG2_30_46_52]